jgi:hypothetical protein
MGKHSKRRSLIGTLLTELRRSHAAGTHGKHAKDRSNTKRKAVQQDRKDSDG